MMPSQDPYNYFLRVVQQRSDLAVHKEPLSDRE